MIKTEEKVEIQGHVPLQLVTPLKDYALIMTADENLTKLPGSKGFVIVSTNAEFLPGEPVIRETKNELVKYPFIGMPQTYHEGECGIGLCLTSMPISDYAPENVSDLGKNPTYVFLSELKKFLDNPHKKDHYKDAMRRPYTVARFVGINWFEYIRSDFHISLEDDQEVSKLERICKQKTVFRVDPKGLAYFGGI